MDQVITEGINKHIHSFGGVHFDCLKVGYHFKHGVYKFFSVCLGVVIAFFQFSIQGFHQLNNSFVINIAISTFQHLIPEVNFVIETKDICRLLQTLQTLVLGEFKFVAQVVCESVEGILAFGPALLGLRK